MSKWKYAGKDETGSDVEVVLMFDAPPPDSVGLNRSSAPTLQLALVGEADPTARVLSNDRGGRVFRTWGGFRAYCNQCDWTSGLVASKRIADGSLWGHSVNKH